MNVIWVLIRSWHAIRLDGKTRCGRTVADDAQQVDTLPDGKSCETCLRWVARQRDVAA